MTVEAAHAKTEENVWMGSPAIDAFALRVKGKRVNGTRCEHNIDAAWVQTVKTMLLALTKWTRFIAYAKMVSLERHVNMKWMSAYLILAKTKQNVLTSLTTIFVTAAMDLMD